MYEQISWGKSDWNQQIITSEEQTKTGIFPSKNVKTIFVSQSEKICSPSKLLLLNNYMLLGYQTLHSSKIVSKYGIFSPMIFKPLCVLKDWNKFSLM